MRRTGWPQALLLLGASLLAACATAPTRVPPDVACAGPLAGIDARVARAGVRDADSAPVPGWPWLRVNRVLASFADEALTPAARAAWLAQLSALDADGRAVEMAALGAAPADPLGEACRARLIAATLADDAAFAALRQRARVPGSYSTGARVLGLYPLAAHLAGRGVARLQAAHTPRAGVLPAPETRVYLPPRIHPALPASVELPRDALGLPHPNAATRRALLDAHAPVWLVATASADDRPGAVHLDGVGNPRLDAVPTVYEYLSYTRFEGAVLLQLNYTLWFPARPPAHRLDVLAGPLDGLVWRVTLDVDGQPLLWDSIHPCGCYHLWFPGPRLTRQVRIGDGEPPWIGPTLMPGAPLAVQVAAGTHYVRAVGPLPDGLHGERLSTRDYDELRRLPDVSGGVQSLFGPDGLVQASARAERFLLWPLGVPAAGSMRQRGHQATAFIGRRHFDDAAGIGRYFQRLRD